MTTAATVEEKPTTSIEFEDFLRLGRLWFIKGKRWGGTKHISDRDLGVDLGYEARKRTSRMLVLIPSEDFSPVDVVVRQAKADLEDCSADLPVGFSVPLRLVSSERSKQLEKNFEEYRRRHAENADRLCYDDYPSKMEKGRDRVVKTLMKLYDDYIFGSEKAFTKATYVDQVNRILDKAYLSPQALRASMDLQGGPFSIQLPDNMSKGAPMEQVMNSMVQGLRESVQDRLMAAKEVFLTAKRLGDKNVDALTKDLEVFSNRNILGDSVVEDAIKKAVDYLSDMDIGSIKGARDKVADVMSEIAQSVDKKGEMGAIRRRLEGTRRRKIK